MIRKIFLGLLAVPIFGLVFGFVLTQTLLGALAGGIACGALVGRKGERIFDSLLAAALTGAAGAVLFIGALFGVAALPFWDVYADFDMDFMAVIVMASIIGSTVSSGFFFFLSKLHP